MEFLDAVDRLGVDGVGVHLHGRSEEVGEVVRAVDRLSASQGGALVLRGDSGIGKRR
ncbi:MAG TPA: hypothetical protein VF940_21270 [Streptosporangiaceae bacterium]